MFLMSEKQPSLYEQFPRPLRTPHAAPPPAIATPWAAPSNKNPPVAPPCTSPESSPGHLRPRSRRTSVPCPEGTTRKYWIFVRNTDEVMHKLAENGNRKSFGIETNSPFDVVFPNSSWTMTINMISFSEVSSAVATKEDVSPLQARISLTSMHHPHEMDWIWQLADFKHTSNCQGLRKKWGGSMNGSTPKSCIFLYFNRIVSYKASSYWGTTHDYGTPLQIGSSKTAKARAF